MNSARIGRALAVVLVLSACGDSGDGAPAFDTDEAHADIAEPSPPAGTPCAHMPELCEERPTIAAPSLIVPSPGLPANVRPQASNNNLDAVWHNGRLFVAFRSASHHLPRDNARLHVISTVDLETWRHEHTLHTGDDLREPNFVSLGGRLLMYFTAVKATFMDFSPLGPYVVEQGEAGWSEPRRALGRGDLIWRINVVGDRAYLHGYRGLSGVLDADVSVLFLESTDGLAWTAAGSQPAIDAGGSTESDSVFLDDGSLLAVTRNEFGDATGFGSKLCRAPAGDLSAWNCVHDPRKMDSPRLFRHDGDVYLVARRHLGNDGTFDRASDLLPREMRLFINHFAYWNAPKRCSLWKVAPDSLQVDHVLDLPGRGDTCFPEVLPLDGQRYLVFNYTSPLGGRDLTWREGQDSASHIYYSILSLP